MALEKNELSITAFSILVAAALGTFSCKRPTTPCDQLYGECNLQSGQCMCSSGGIGLQCSVSGGTVNSGACHIMNPCLNGATCYDNGVGSSCSCPDGFYGDRCQHPMVYWKCYPDKMEVNIFPYGYDVHGWNSGKPGTGKDNSCKLETIPTVRTQGLNYVLPAWDGFAGQFKHLNDSCAGNATVEWDNSTGTMYSRRIYVSYSATYFHETDQDIVVKCEVIKPQQTLPTKRPNAVNYYITDQHGWPVESPVKLGSRINVTFHVDPLSGFVDLKILDCLVLDVGSTTPVVVVTNSCPEPPIGLALTKPSGGMHVLTLTMYKFPGFANDLHFQCRARVCLAADKTCNMPPGCPTRIKRSVRSAAAAWSPSDNILIIDSRSVK